MSQNCTLLVEPSLDVNSPQTAAKLPIAKMLVAQKEPKYAPDLIPSCKDTAGSTPSTPPGPAIPCTIPTHRAISRCTVAFLQSAHFEVLKCLGLATTTGLNICAHAGGLELGAKVGDRAPSCDAGSRPCISTSPTSLRSSACSSSSLLRKRAPGPCSSCPGDSDLPSTISCEAESNELFQKDEK